LASDKAKILLADDEEDTVAILKDALEDDGYTVLTALDGRDVLNFVKQENPDLLILDLRMPGLDGERILQTIDQTGIAPGMKVFILTGFNDFNVTKERIQRKFQHLVVDYLEKPVDLNSFCDRIARRLERK
jgi:CheY-like chemotaxis protein